MPASRIQKQEWDRVKDAFNDLYYVRGLPLHKEGDGESVQRILQAEYNFTARWVEAFEALARSPDKSESHSRSQYDAHVKSLAQPKNLKKAEWRVIHGKLRELLELGIEARVTLSGKRLSTHQLRRSRRHAFSGHDTSHASSSDSKSSSIS
jgi:hypothetical protein